MNLIPEPMSAVGKQQLDAQINLLRKATGSAFDSAEKLMALHFDATRATLEQSSSLMRQVAAAKDPRDLFALASQGQSQLESVLAYQRKLFGLASAIGSSLSGLQPVVTPTASAALEKLAALPAVAAVAADSVVAEASAQAQTAATKTADVTVELIDSASAPVTEAALPAAEPIAALTPVAAATGHVEAHPSAAPVHDDAPAPAIKTGSRPKKR